MSRPQVVLSVAGAKQPARVRGDLIGDDQVEGGVGGWEETEFGKKKARRLGLAYKGTPGFRVTVTLGFNGIGQGGIEKATSVEPQCRRLQSFGRPRSKGARPPRLKVAGLLRTPGNMVWVIDSISWGAQIRNSHGQRVQQIVDVTLVQYRPPGAKKSPADK